MCIPASKTCRVYRLHSDVTLMPEARVATGHKAKVNINSPTILSYRSCSVKAEGKALCPEMHGSIHLAAVSGFSLVIATCVI